MKSKTSYLLLLILFFSIKLSAQKVEYARQEITIGKMKCINNQYRDNVEGILITFPCSLKYGKKQIMGADTSDALSTFYVYPEIRINNSLIFHPQDKPEATWLSATTNYYNSVKADKPGKKADLSFFIPYHRFYIGQGEYNCKISIHACNRSGDLVFEKLAKDTIHVSQPKMSVSLLNLKNLEVKYKDNYDYAGRNVPFWNLFYGKRSNRGYGYPDVQWQIIVGNDAVYSSEISWDAFIGFDGTCVFQSGIKDPVEFYASDYDLFFSDDHIGRYKIGQGSSSEEKHFTSLSFDEVKNMNLDYYKRPVPQIRKKNVKLEHNQKQNGVSGIRVRLDYSLEQPNELIPIIAKPFITTGNYDDFSEKYFKTENQLKYYKMGGYSIGSVNSQGTTEVFYPYYKLIGGEIPNYKFNIGQYDVEFDRTQNKESITIPEFDDVTWSALKGSETSRNGLFGLWVDAVQKLPEAYTNNFSPNRFEFSYILTPSIFGKTQADTLFSTSKSFFLPYSKMKFVPGTQAAVNLSRKVMLEPDSGRKICIGKQNTAFDFKMPVMWNVEIKSVNIKLKKFVCNQGDWICLVHGSDTLLLEEMSKQYNSAKLHLKKKLTDIKMYCHPRDAAMIVIISNPTNGFMRQSRLIASFAANEMQAGGSKFFLAKSNDVKKGKLNYKIQSAGESVM
ncbi:MAG: hypothetical protein V2A54_02215 [Bacteroidota bacterium]